MAEKQLTVAMVMRDNFSGPLAKQKSNLQDFAKAASIAGIAAAAGVGALIGGAVNAFGTFEQKMSNIRAVSGATGAEFTGLSNLALQFGKDTAFSASEAAGGMEELIKAGVSIPDVMNGAAQATLDLAAAGEIALPEAASIAAAAMNSFGMTGEQMPHVADLIAGAANASAISVQDFGESIKQIGPTASIIGAPLDDVSTAIALMGDYGIKGSMAGNTLKRAMLSLAAPSNEAAAKIKELGLNIFDSTGKILPLNQVAQELQNKIGGLSKVAQTAALNDIFGSFGLAAGAVLMKEGAAGVDAMTASMAKVSAADVAKEKLNNLFGSLEQLRGSVETLAIQFGAAFGPILRSAVDGVTGLINSLLPLAEAFAVWLPGAFNSWAMGSNGAIAQVSSAFWGFVGFIQANIPLILVMLGLIGTTLLVNVAIPAALAMAQFGAALLFNGVGSIAMFALSIFTTLIPAIATFASVLLTQGIGAAVSYAATQLGIVAPANLATGLSFYQGLIPGALAAASTFLTTTIPAAIATGVAFVTGTVPGVLVAANAFLMNLIPAALAAAATFVTTTVPAAIAAGVAFLTGVVPGALAAGVAMLTGIVPAALAAGAGFLSLAATALVALAGVVVSAVTAAIGVAIAFAPLIIAVGLVGIAAYLLYQNWATIWGAITSFTGKVTAAIWRIIGGTVAAIGKTVSGFLSALVRMWQKGFTLVASVTGKVLSWLGGIFGKVMGMLLSAAGKAAGGIKNALVSGISSMASGVMNIIGELASKVGEALSRLVNFAVEAVMSLPGATQIAGLIGGMGSKISNGLSSIKGMLTGGFKGAGADSREAFDEGWDGKGSQRKMDTPGGGLEGMLKDLGFDLPDMEGFSAEDLMGGTGAPEGKGGGGAAVKDPLGQWGGTDNKGDWVIDPGTGKKVYEEGSVGALQQQNAASKAAEKAGKAGLGKKTGGGLTAGMAEGMKGSESLDLAKAFTEAIDAAIGIMQAVAEAKIPPPDTWVPKLKEIENFFIVAGGVFARVASNASRRNAIDMAQGQFLNAWDIDNIAAWSEPMNNALAMLDKTVDLMGKLNDLKVPELTVMDRLEDFVIRAAGIAARVAGSVDKTTAEALTPVATGMSSWVELLGKAATSLEALGKAQIGSGMSDQITKVAALLMDIGAKMGTVVTSAQKALGDGLAKALAESRDVAATFGAWFDQLSKVGAVAESVGKVNLPPGALEGLRAFMVDLAALGAGFVTGLAKAIPPDLRAAALTLSRDVAATFGAWFDSLSKGAATINLIASNKVLPAGSLAGLQDMMREVATFAASLIKGPGYDLTRDAGRTAQDLGIVRDVMTTIGAAVDVFSKAAGLAGTLAAAEFATVASLQKAEYNAASAFYALQSLADEYANMDAVTRGELFARMKAYAEVLGPAVDVLVKAAGLAESLAKAQFASVDSLYKAEYNASVAFYALQSLADEYANMEAAARTEMLGQMKAYADVLGPAVDVVTKAAGLAGAVAAAEFATIDALTRAEYNAAVAFYALQSLADEYANMALAARTELFARMKAYAEVLGPALDILAKAAGLGEALADGTRVTDEGLTIAKDNARAAVGALELLAGEWGHLEIAARDLLFAGMKAYADTVGPAVDMLGKAAGLGKELADTMPADPALMAIAEANAKAAVASVQTLADEWLALAGEEGPKLLAGMKSYGDMAGEAVELATKAAGLGEALAKAKPVDPSLFALVGDQIKASVRMLAGVMQDIGPEIAAQAKAMAVAAGPVLEVIGKALEVFSIDKILASPLVSKHLGRSSVMGRAASTRAQAMANNIKAGIALMFSTLSEAISGIAPPDPADALKIQMMVAAYDPLLDLIAKLNGLKVNLDEIKKLALVPGLLGAGMGGAAGGGGGSGTAAAAISVTINTAIITGAVTALGPVLIQGPITIPVYVDGEMVGNGNTGRAGTDATGV